MHRRTRIALKLAGLAFIPLLLMAGAFWLVERADDITAVQQARTLPSLTNEELVKQIAGFQGKIHWSHALMKQRYADDVVRIEAMVERPVRDGGTQSLTLEFHYNRTKARVSFHALRVNDQQPEFEFSEETLVRLLADAA